MVPTAHVVGDQEPKLAVAAKVPQIIGSLGAILKDSLIPCMARAPRCHPVFKFWGADHLLLFVRGNHHAGVMKVCSTAEHVGFGI
jgi:hypothetical protein